jgi:hypothetical protein
MHIRSRSRDRSRSGGGGASALSTLASFGASDAWDFVADQYIRAGTVGPSGLTVTRASDGYAQREDGIWQLFGSGVLRRTDKGVLLERARINRALHSRDLTQAAWTATNVTVARNQVGIDGTANSACSLTATAANGTVLQAVTDTSGQRYFSVWIRRITGTGTVEVTLDNGSTWTAVTVTSAYTRVGATQTLANPTVGVRLVTDTDAVAIDFAQLEASAFPSSPIETAGSTATRAADVVSAVPTSGPLFPLSLYAEFERSTDANSNEGIVQASGASRERRLTLFILGTNDTLQAAVRGTSTNGDSETAGAIPLNIVQKSAGRFAEDDVLSARNGTLGAVDTTSGVTVTTLDLMEFGYTGISTAYGFLYIRRAAIIPRALSDAELQAITGP